MARKRDTILLRKQDGSGAGVIYRTREDANKFLSLNPGYTEESAEETDANQRAADEQVEAKAQAPAEDKAVAAPRARG